MKCSIIAKFLQKELVGEDIDIVTFSSLSHITVHSVVFVKKYSDEYFDVLNNARDILAIACEEYRNKLLVPHIISTNPRLDYLRVVGKFFVEEEFSTGIHPTAVVEKGAKIGKNVLVGAHCYIGSKVSVGDNTIILHNTSIYGDVSIGADGYIKPGVVIGGPGFGFEYDEDGVPVHFPHTGSVKIGNNVYIGANTSIDRATIDSTIIEDNVKIDDLVHVAHNCIIKENTLITGGAMLGGGVVVEKNAWISPNSTIHQKLKIGKHAKVGIGSVVLRNVKDDTIVFGVPANKVKL